MQNFASPDPEPTGFALLELLRPNAAPAAAGVGLARVPLGLRRDVHERTEGPTGPDGREAGLAAMVELRLDRQGAEHIEAFERRALADVAVRQVWRVSPGPDFVLIVQCADMAAYHALTKRLFRQKWNVRNVKTRFALRRAKAGHRGGTARGRQDAGAYRQHETDRARDFAWSSPYGHQMPWAECERHVFDAAPWPVVPGPLQSSTWASPASFPVGSGRGRRPASVDWRTCVAGATQAVVFGVLDGAALEFRIPHFFVAEVRALAA